MDFRDSPAEAAWRDEVRTWLHENLVGEFAEISGRGGVADEATWEIGIEWERVLGASRFVGLSWPEQYGGRNASIVEQVIFYEEYAKAHAPDRVGFFGEQLFAPTLIAHGTEAQKHRFLPKIQAAEELWCQGYSEPDAGSDLAAVATKAVLDGNQWVVNGQKVWTSLAHRAQWCFALVRTNPDVAPHKGLTYLLVPMDQPGVTVRPLMQMMGTAEFSEVFFDNACTDADLVVGAVDDGWNVAMATLGFERGTAFLSQQYQFQEQLADVIALARENLTRDRADVRQLLAQAYVGLEIMKFNRLRMISRLVRTGVLGPESSIDKLFWSTWHRDLGELAMAVLGPSAVLANDREVERYTLDEQQRIFLSSRAETIYAGSSEIQRNIIGERVLGLPREPR